MKKYVFLLLLFIAAKGYAQQLSITNLQCESKTAPVGIDRAMPKFNWQLQSAQRGVLQTAYRILVADKRELLEKNQGNTWDSKKISSGQSIQILFKGNKELKIFLICMLVISFSKFSAKLL